MEKEIKELKQVNTNLNKYTGSAIDEHPGVQINVQNDTNEEENNDDPRVPKKIVLLAMIGLSSGFFLVTLNNTIVSTALPTIATDLDSFSMISWVVTSFLLTSTVFQPIYCKVAEIFEKRIMILFGLFMFEVGCLLCGMSNSIIMLVIARFIAGFGSAGVFGLVILSIADLVPLRERGKYVGINSALFALSSVLGPLVGGFFTDKVSWRWCFYINLPLGFVAFIVMFFVLPFKMPKGNLVEKLKTIDFVGTIVFLGSFLMIILGLNMGGTKYSWNSPVIIGLFVGGILLLVFFVYVEINMAKDPIIPMEIFKIRNVTFITIGQFCVGVGLFTLIYYSPVFYHLMYNGPAVSQGLFLLPALITMVTFSIVSGYGIAITGIYRPVFWVGTAVFTIGMALLGTMKQTTPRALQSVYLAASGFGAGCLIQTMVVIAQASVTKRYVLVTTSVVQFMRIIGGTFGVAIVATVFNTTLANSLASVALDYPEYADLLKHVVDNSSLAWDPSLPLELHTLLISHFTKSISYVYFTAVPFLAIAFVCTLLIKPVSLGKRK
ncbi:putative MFS-type transporter YusP [Zancudomyces culisetae]|uniref:Putative MFS-type transporter YusP n=1 Tax=Zancudomyces culisetae TaxID=1213189 RepID=A0A1R1PKT5_ZANCU|nr:putative MFS-type transporter YusP [Zancudomyces culisetae]|eukprot:OMH81574.1 putative MFS-type transporter YusP [Zancudomyces culisetae]